MRLHKFLSLVLATSLLIASSAEATPLMPTLQASETTFGDTPMGKAYRDKLSAYLDQNGENGGVFVEANGSVSTHFGDGSPRSLTTEEAESLKATLEPTIWSRYRQQQIIRAPLVSHAAKHPPEQSKRKDRLTTVRLADLVYTQRMSVTIHREGEFIRTMDAEIAFEWTENGNLYLTVPKGPAGMNTGGFDILTEADVLTIDSVLASTPPPHTAGNKRTTTAEIRIFEGDKVLRETKIVDESYSTDWLWDALLKRAEFAGEAQAEASTTK
ncbi:hypothetical protein BH09SUM1_BH09SUM1_15520 [soil metagenome]